MPRAIHQFLVPGYLLDLQLVVCFNLFHFPQVSLNQRTQKEIFHHVFIVLVICGQRFEFLHPSAFILLIIFVYVIAFADIL